MMPKRKAPTIPPPQVKPKSKDFGPSIRRKASTLPPLPSENASAQQRAQYAAAIVKIDPRRMVVKEDRTDPILGTGALLRGARVLDPVLFMFRQSKISKREFDAVEAFRDAVAYSNGARENQPDDAGVRTPMSNRNWPSDEQLDASGFVEATWEKFNDDEKCMAQWVIIDHRSIDDFAIIEQMRRDTAAMIFRGVLAVLVRRYRNRGAMP